MEGASYHVQEKKQAFWKSLAEASYEVVDAHDKILLSATIANTFGAPPSASLHLPEGEFQTHPVGLGPVGPLFWSYTISQGETKLCLVVPESPLTQKAALISDEERGYPCLLCIDEGDGRRLVSVDGKTTIARLHSAWRDSERAKNVVGTFELETPLVQDSHPLALLAATVETLRNLQGQGTVVSGV